MSRCLSCQNGTMRQGTVPYTRELAEGSFTVNVNGARCDHCGDIDYPALALEQAELQIAGELARAGITSPEIFRLQRSALGLKIADLAELLGVTATTISRWENEARALDLCAAAILGRLVLDKREGRQGMLDQLRAMRAPSTPVPQSTPKTAAELSLKDLEGQVVHVWLVERPGDSPQGPDLTGLLVSLYGPDVANGAISLLKLSTQNRPVYSETPKSDLRYIPWHAVKTIQPV